MCDCNHSLVGVISLAPAGDFNFTQSASESERLEVAVDNPADVLPLSLTEADWPTYRKNNQRTAETPVSVAEPVKLAWEYLSASPVAPTAPITVDGLTFVSGSDGIVHAFENENGRERWRAYTGGRVHYPPTYWNGRLYAGSADGCVYAWEAATGRRLWRFRAAPIERMIPLYGGLSSTWPVASGALADDGVVYAAAGIVSHDGTHVYALDAVTGTIRWQNNTSGELMGEDIVCGVSVQGHMLLHDGKLYLAGGNVVSPAVYDVQTGACLNTLDDQWQKGPRGSELFLIGDEVRVFDRMLYGVREYIPSRYYAKYLLHAGGQSGRVYQGTETEMMCVDLPGGADDKAKLVWKQEGFVETAGVAVAKNAILALVQVADQLEKEPASTLVMLDANDGRVRLRQPLPTLATAWGLAVDRDGRIVVTTVDGRVQCYASP
jgi:outer membrane protein assembly factor BamB